MLTSLPPKTLCQRDGAFLHHICEVQALLVENLSYFCIEKGGPTNWLACSSNIIPLGFSLWEYVKNKVYSTRVRSVAQLKRRITSAICSVRADVLQNIWKIFGERLNKVVRRNGGHIEHL